MSLALPTSSCGPAATASTRKETPLTQITSYRITVTCQQYPPPQLCSNSTGWELGKGLLLCHPAGRWGTAHHLHPLPIALLGPRQSEPTPSSHLAVGPGQRSNQVTGAGCLLPCAVRLRSSPQALAALCKNCKQGPALRVALLGDTISGIWVQEAKFGPVSGPRCPLALCGQGLRGVGETAGRDFLLAGPGILLSPTYSCPALLPTPLAWYTWHGPRFASSK